MVYSASDMSSSRNRDSASTIPSLPSALFDESSSIDVVDEGSKSRVHRNNESQLNRINKQIEVYQLKVASERKRLLGLNEKIIQVEVKSLEHNRRVGGDNSTSNKQRKIGTEKSLQIDRLNKKLSVLNTKISQNKELRQKIDEMRQERCRYDEIYTRLEYGIQGQAEQMSCVLSNGKRTIKSRDKAICELDALTKQFEENKIALRSEQEELRQLEESYEDKQAKIAESMALSRPETVASQKTTADENKSDQIDEFDDERALNDALSKVFKLTGINDVGVLIERLVQTDEIHFGLFSRINEIEAQASEYETKISDAGQELKRVQRCGIMNDTQRQKELSSMEDERRQLHEKTNDVEAQFREQLEVWNSVRSRILTVHDELGLKVPEDLSGTNSVTENNVMQYLAAIEHKASEILTANNEDDDGDQGRHRTPSSTVNQNMKTQMMELPSATCDESGLDDDDGERPFTMKELQESLRVTG